MDIVFWGLVGGLIIIIIIGLSIASYADSHVVERYKKFENYNSSSFTTAKDFAVMTSINFLDSNVKIGQKKGFLTDAYSPSKKVVFLSETVYDSSSISALAVAAHELGHALQDKENPKTLKRLAFLSVLGSVVGRLMFPLFLAGVILFLMQSVLYALICLGGAVGIFLLSLILKLMTISIEKDASKKALMLLGNQRVLEGQELNMAKKMLDAALLTYIADFLRVILSWTFMTKKPKLF